MSRDICHKRKKFKEEGGLLDPFAKQLSSKIITSPCFFPISPSPSRYSRGRQNCSKPEQLRGLVVLQLWLSSKLEVFALFLSSSSSISRLFFSLRWFTKHQSPRDKARHKHYLFCSSREGISGEVFGHVFPSDSLVIC